MFAQQNDVFMEPGKLFLNCSLKSNWQKFEPALNETEFPCLVTETQK